MENDNEYNFALETQRKNSQFYVPDFTDITRKFADYILPQHKCAAVSAILWGLIAHLFHFTNQLLSHDGMNLTFSAKGYASGRWFQELATYPGYFVNAPWAHAVLVLFYFAITAMLLVEIFQMKSRFSIVLLTGALVAYPAVTATLSYLFVADGLILAVLLATCAVLVTKKYKLGLIPGAVLLALALAVYQTNMAWAISLILILLFWQTLDTNINLKQWLTHAVHQMIMGALGFVIYYLVVQIQIRFFGITLMTYKGLDVLGSGFTGLIKTVFFNITRAYQWFQPLQLPGFYTKSRVLFLGFYFLLGFTLAIFYSVKQKAYRSAWRVAAALVTLLLLPLGLNSITLLNDEFYILMMQPYSLLFMILPIGLDKLTVHSVSITATLLRWASALVGFAICWQFCITANTAYLNMYMRMQTGYSITLRIADRIEQLEKYEPGMPVLFIGNLRDSFSNESILDPLIMGMTDMNGVSLAHDSNQHLRRYLTMYHGMLIKNISSNGKTLTRTRLARLEDEFAQYTAVQEMPSFPRDGCVKIIDRYVVVRLS